MKVILQRSANAPWQQLDREWFGSPVIPPLEFRFRLTEDALILTARRASPALLHPEAREGCFQEQLWKYDTAEFFIAAAEGTRYLEFNLAPNGAWWAAVFTSPRMIDSTFPAVPEGIVTRGHADAEGWECEARVPLDLLRQLGITPDAAPCRLAADAILGSPAQLFLTTATDTEGRPDFHRPWGWDFCLDARQET